MRLTVSDPRLGSILNSLPNEKFYLTHQGELLPVEEIGKISQNDLIQVHFKLCGGKGGFGSLLRAIGSQIHRTTDRESCRNLDGTRIRAVNDEKKLEEARKRKIVKDAENAEIREKKKARKMEEIVQTASGHHGGKHYYEDEEFVTSKKKSTENTLQSVSVAAQKMKKDAEARKIREEELARKREEDGESSDSSCGSMEDEFMPIKTPVHTGPVKSIQGVQGGTATRGAKTETHNNVMWSHLIGKNVDDNKQIEIVNYEDVNLEELESLDSLMELGGERLMQLLMLRGLKTAGTIPERADRLWKVKGLKPAEYPAEFVVQR